MGRRRRRWNAYFGVSDLLTQKPGGIRAVNLATGTWLERRAANARSATPKQTCRASQGAAVTAIPGAVFSGSLDGGMRAYSTKDGAILWSFDTNKEFPTVNGVKANGGGIEGPGADRRRRHALLQFRLRRLRRQPWKRAARIRNRLIARLRSVGRVLVWTRRTRGSSSVTLETDLKPAPAS